MTVGGSLQLRQFRIAVRNGVDIEVAAAAAGMSLNEASAWVIDDAKNPPPPEAYKPLTPAPVGHNSGETTVSETIAVDQLRLLIERAERLIEERKAMSEDIRDVFLEAKSTGFDVPTMKEMIKLRAQEKHKRDEKQALVELYGHQLGLF